MENEDVVAAVQTGNAASTSKWLTIVLPIKVWLILEVWWYAQFCNYCTVGNILLLSHKCYMSSIASQFTSTLNVVQQLVQANNKEYITVPHHCVKCHFCKGYPLWRKTPNSGHCIPLTKASNLESIFMFQPLHDVWCLTSLYPRPNSTFISTSHTTTNRPHNFHVRTLSK